MNEQWKPIDGYEGYYEVSDMGRVRSIDRVVTRSGSIPVMRKGRILRPGKGNGYSFVTLQKNGRSERRKISRLVCHAFNGNGDHIRNEVAHSDGDRSNDRACNLRWASRRENELDKISHGTIMAGEKHGMAKINEKTVADIRHTRQKLGLSYLDLSKRFGISKSQVYRIANRKAWRCVSD